MSDTETRQKPFGTKARIELDALSPRERVVSDIVRGLYDGSFEAGQRLVEAQLTERYGVSRGPVREALNRLAAMGVVELAPQRGAQIRILSVDDAIDTLIVAQGLVGIAARLAAENEDAVEGRARLAAVVKRLMQFEETSPTAEYALARDAFYSTLSELADNAALHRVMMQPHMHLIRAQFRSILRTVDRRRHRDYSDIMKAILENNPAKAERAARAHLGRPIVALKDFRARDTTD